MSDAPQYNEMTTNGLNRLVIKGTKAQYGDTIENQRFILSIMIIYLREKTEGRANKKYG